MAFICSVSQRLFPIDQLSILMRTYTLLCSNALCWSLRVTFTLLVEFIFNGPKEKHKYLHYLYYLQLITNEPRGVNCQITFVAASKAQHAKFIPVTDGKSAFLLGLVLKSKQKSQLIIISQYLKIANTH